MAKSGTFKAAAKAAEVKTEEKKTAPLSGEVKTEEKKAAVEKETEVKETPVRKPAVKKAAPAKTAAPKKEADPKEETEVKASVFIQYGEKEIAAKKVLEEVEKAYLSEHEGAVIKTVEVYIKPEENAAYYVVNGEGSGTFKVAL